MQSFDCLENYLSVFRSHDFKFAGCVSKVNSGKEIGIFFKRVEIALFWIIITSYELVTGNLGRGTSNHVGEADYRIRDRGYIDHHAHYSPVASFIPLLSFECKCNRVPKIV